MQNNSRRRPHLRAVLVLPAAVAMLLGLDAGLNLLDVWAPVTAGRLADSHGLLMVLGFVGALVSLERAVALANSPRRIARLGFGAPLGLGLGALAQLSALTARTGSVLLLLGAAGLVAVYVPLWRRQRDDAVLVQALGAVLALGATVLWLGGVEVSVLVPWLACFLILTIAGERLELARLAIGPGPARQLVQLAFAVSLATGASLLWPAVGAPLLGLTLVTLCAWLVRHDVARRTVNSQGLARFMGWSMLAGQAWLGVAGAIWLVGGPITSGAAYDAVVHAVFLGYTMSMIIAHAPVILPAVTGLGIPFHRVMYVPMVALQVSLVLRLWWGDALGSELARQAGGVVNVLAVLGFFATVVWSIARRPSAPAGSTRPARPASAVDEQLVGSRA